MIDRKISELDIASVVYNTDYIIVDNTDVTKRSTLAVLSSLYTPVDTFNKLVSGVDTLVDYIGTITSNITATNPKYESTHTTVTANSANWNSVYSSVCALSTTWQGGSFGDSELLPLSGGTMTGPIYFGYSYGSKIDQGIYDTYRGGISGISLVCSVAYDLNWQAGWITSLEQDRITPRPLYIDSGAGTSVKVWDEISNTGIQTSHTGITFPDNSIQSTAFTKTVQVTNISAFTYTIALSDSSSYIRKGFESEHIILIPSFVQAAFEIGSIITIRNISTSKLTISCLPTITLNFFADLSANILDQYASAQIVCVGTDNWDII
jgi:hypothetical protein